MKVELNKTELAKVLRDLYFALDEGSKNVFDCKYNVTNAHDLLNKFGLGFEE